ncbi:hypothetical protein GW17_00025824, partial [Ensete ventricosum]
VVRDYKIWESWPCSDPGDEINPPIVYPGHPGPPSEFHKLHNCCYPVMPDGVGIDCMGAYLCNINICLLPVDGHKNS